MLFLSYIKQYPSSYKDHKFQIENDPIFINLLFFYLTKIYPFRIKDILLQKEKHIFQKVGNFCLLEQEY